jgi:hypothetical protein
MPKPDTDLADANVPYLTRWLDEREKRVLAENSIRENAQAYEALSEARDREIERQRRWKVIAWLVAVLSCVAGWAAIGFALWLLSHH